MTNKERDIELKQSDKQNRKTDRQEKNESLQYDTKKNWRDWPTQWVINWYASNINKFNIGTFFNAQKRNLELYRLKKKKIVSL